MTSPPPLRPALWDQLIVPYRGTPLYDYASPDAAQARLQRRIVPFPAAVDDASPGARANLARHYAYRLKCWQYLGSSIVRDEDFHRNLFALGRAGPSIASTGILWVPIFFLYACTKRAFGRGTIPYLQRALDDRHCPDCAYDLRKALGLTIGKLTLPAQCSECGSTWPLLPPGLAYQVDGLERPS